MDAISVPGPPRLTPMISADRFSVNPDSSAAGTLLITWLAATPARTSCPEMSCYRLYRFPIGVSVLTKLTATVCKITTGTISCHALPTVLKSTWAAHGMRRSFVVWLWRSSGRTGMPVSESPIAQIFFVKGYKKHGTVIHRSVDPYFTVCGAGLPLGRYCGVRSRWRMKECRLALLLLL